MKTELQELLELLEIESSEPCRVPISVPASESLRQRYKDVGALTAKVYGRNKIPRIARMRIIKMLDEVEALALEKLNEKMASE